MQTNIHGQRQGWFQSLPKKNAVSYASSRAEESGWWHGTTACPAQSSQESSCLQVESEHGVCTRRCRINQDRAAAAICPLPAPAAGTPLWAAPISAQGHLTFNTAVSSRPEERLWVWLRARELVCGASSQRPMFSTEEARTKNALPGSPAVARQRAHITTSNYQ